MPTAEERRLRGWKAADNRHNMGLPPEVRGHRSNERLDHFSVGADLDNPFIALPVALGQEALVRPLLTAAPGLAPLVNTLLGGTEEGGEVFNFDEAGAVDPYRRLSSRERGENVRDVLAGALNESYYDPVRRALGLDLPDDVVPVGAPDPTPHTYSPGDVDPVTGQPLEITYGVEPPRDATDALTRPIPTPRNPPLGNGGPVDPSEPFNFDGGDQPNAADAMPDPDDEFDVTDTLPTGRPINDLLAPDPKNPTKRKNPVISGSGPHVETQFDRTNAAESRAQTSFLQGGDQYDPRTGAPTDPRQDTTQRNRRDALADEYGQSGGIMPDLFGGGGGFGGGFIPLF